MDKWQDSQKVTDKDNFSLLHVARFILGGMALIYMFGQLFFSSFSISSTVVALSGFIIAFTSQQLITKNHSIQVRIIACSFIGVAGISYEIYKYYSNQQLPGNNYPLAMSVVFITAFLVAGIYSEKFKNA